MRHLIAGHGSVRIAGSLISVASGAQSPTDGDGAPLSDRERSLLDRIRRLEAELAGLRDVEARLAAVEAKIGADADPLGNRPTVSVSAGAPTLPPTGEPYWNPRVRGEPNVPAGLVILTGWAPYGTSNRNSPTPPVASASQLTGQTPPYEDASAPPGPASPPSGTPTGQQPPNQSAGQPAATTPASSYTGPLPMFLATLHNIPMNLSPEVITTHGTPETCG